MLLFLLYFFINRCDNIMQYLLIDVTLLCSFFLILIFKKEEVMHVLLLCQLHIYP
jgi:hypothetical protein